MKRILSWLRGYTCITIKDVIRMCISSQDGEGEGELYKTLTKLDHLFYIDNLNKGAL